MVRILRSFAVGFLAALLLAGVFLSGYLLGGGKSRSAAAHEPAFDVLWQVQDLLQSGFLGDIPNAQTQAYGAIHGLVASYKDPYTVFVEPAAREVEQDELRGHFGGIGAQLGRNDKGDMVVTVMRDRPAARAGVVDGDVLLSVDGKEITTDTTVEEVVALIRGDIGTGVVLTLSRSGSAGPFDVRIIRERIETPSVEWRILDQERHIGYVRITLFAENTASDIRAAIGDLKAHGIDKLVLDLRNNGGGLLDAAVETTGLFLRDGDVLHEVKRGGQERYYPIKKSHSAAQDWEVVLLVDGGTASASEIVAGALKDYGRSILIGEKTFGKGSVQEVHALPDGSSLHITVARWLTPNRHQIDKAGLLPDVQVGISAEDRAAGRDPQLQRAQSWLEGVH